MRWYAGAARPPRPENDSAAPEANRAAEGTDSSSEHSQNITASGIAQRVRQSLALARLMPRTYRALLANGATISQLAEALPATAAALSGIAQSLPVAAVAVAGLLGMLIGRR
jgi:hypothetical protein